MIWRGSQNLGKKSQLFTGVLYNGYAPPEGFCFDELGNYCDDPSLKGDIKARIKLFIKKTCAQAERYRTNHIMLTMGGDFNYRNAQRWFKNMDILIDHANKVYFTL